MSNDKRTTNGGTGSSKMGIVVVGGLVGALLVCCCGCSGVGWVFQDSVKRLFRPDDISQVEPRFRLTAEEFSKEFETNPNSAAQKYRGRVIELSGEVKSVARNFDGESVVTLKAEGQAIGVTCITADKEPWGKAVRGQKIKIKGKAISGKVIDCVFVETGEYAGIRISATDLAREYAADREGTVKKYDTKHLVVSGEVASKNFNEVRAANIELKTDNKVKVACSFTALEKDLTEPIRVGETIRVVGEFTLNFGVDDKVELFSCLPLSGK
jgi:uncharacterized protein (DUF1330 family)